MTTTGTEIVAVTEAPERVRDLVPGESRQVNIAIPRRWLALWSDTCGARVVADDGITILAGPSSDNLSLHADT